MTYLLRFIFLIYLSTAILGCSDTDNEPDLIETEQPEGNEPPEEEPEEQEPPEEEPPEQPPSNDDHGNSVSAALNGVKTITLDTSELFDATEGETNPFSEVSFQANVTAPDGASHKVLGFFNGDGNGGNEGTQFSFRIYAHQPGTWMWTTESNNQSLDAQSGSFVVTSDRETGLLHGAVTTSSNGKYFVYEDDTPVFLVGKFLDHSQPSPLRYSHTFFSDSLSDSDREAMFAHHVSLGVNKINLYLANIGDYNSMSVIPWQGNSANNDKTRFDLELWNQVDTWVDRFTEAGIHSHFWFFADDSSFGGLSSDAHSSLAKYAMARLSANRGTLFTTALEWQESFSTSKIALLGNTTQKNNPWDRLVAVHEIDNDFESYNETWLDFLDTQPGFVDSDTIYNYSLRHRNLVAKPLIIEEFTFGEETAENREKTWSALLSVPAGIGTGASLNGLAEFASRVALHTLAPQTELYVKDSRYVAGNDSRYVIYQPQSSSFNYELNNVTNQWFGYWYNPRTAEWQTASFSASGDSVSATAPDSEDWVFVISEDMI